MRKGIAALTKDFYTVRDIAQQLQVKERTVRRFMKNGDLVAVKIFGKWIVTAENLKAYVNAKSQGV